MTDDKVILSPHEHLTDLQHEALTLPSCLVLCCSAETGA